MTFRYNKRLSIYKQKKLLSRGKKVMIKRKISQEETKGTLTFLVSIILLACFSTISLKFSPSTNFKEIPESLKTADLYTMDFGKLECAEVPNSIKIDGDGELATE